MVMRAVIRAIPAIAVATFVVLFNTLVLFFLITRPSHADSLMTTV